MSAVTSGGGGAAPARAGDTPRIRSTVFFYTLCWLVILIAAAVIYIFQWPWPVRNIAPLTTQYADKWPGRVAVSVWFAVLGGVAISLKGVYDHYRREEWAGGEWDLWYFGRPVSGLIVGVMIYVLLRVVNNAEPQVPALAVAAFTLGTQEKRFFTFLAEVANLVLTVPKDLQTGLLIKAIRPDRGPAGIPVLVFGQGMHPGSTVTLGSRPLEHVVVSPDGTSAAGAIPAAAMSGLADIIVTNPDGAARVLRQGFTVT